MHLFHFLVAFATGSRSDELREHPDDRGHYATLAVLNLLTSVCSGLMAMVAMLMARGGDLVQYAPIGALYGTFIFTVDRFLIAPRATSKRAGLMTAFRLVVAVTLGSAVAAPALAGFYEADINRTFAIADQAAAKVEASTATGAIDDEIAALEARTTRQREAATSTRGRATALRGEADAELNSSVGGRPPGPGPEWRKKNAAAVPVESAATASENALTTLESRLTTLQETRSSRAAAATTESLSRHHGLSDRLKAVDDIVPLKQRIVVILLFALLDAAVSLFKIFVGRTGIELARERRLDDEELAELETITTRLDSNRRRRERRIALEEQCHEDRVAVATARSRRRRDIALARIRVLGL